LVSREAGSREVVMLQNLFSSSVRVALLTHLFTHPYERFYARELARVLDVHYNAVWRELNNLQAIGLLVGEENATVKYYRLNPQFPIYDERKRIVLKTTGLGGEGALRETAAEQTLALATALVEEVRER